MKKIIPILLTFLAISICSFAETEDEQIDQFIADLQKTNIPDIEKYLEHPTIPLDWMNELGAHRAMLKLKKLIKPDYDNQSIVAITIIEELDYREVIPDLIQLLKHKDNYARWYAADALGRRRVKEAIPELRKLLKDDDYGIRRAAIRALGEMGDKDSIPAIIKFLNDKENLVKSSAIWALVALDAKESASAMMKLVQAKQLPDDDDHVTESIAGALGDLGCTESIPLLMQLLFDNRFAVPGRAALSLGKLGAKGAVPKLIKLLAEDEDGECSDEAAEALGLIGTPEAIARLISLSKDKDGAKRYLAVESLIKAGKAKYFPEVIKLINDKYARVRMIIIKAIGDLGLQEYKPKVIALLSDKDVQAECALACAKLKATEAIPTLRELFVEQGARTDTDILHALAKLGDRQFSSELINRMEDKKRVLDIRINALMALVDLKCEAAIPGLKKLLNNSNQLVRAYAAVGLVELDAKDSVPQVNIDEVDRRILGIDVNWDIHIKNALKALGKQN